MIKESTGPMRGRLFQYRRGILRALLIVCSMLGPWAQRVHAEKFVIAWSAVGGVDGAGWLLVALGVALDIATYSARSAKARYGSAY